MSLDRRNVKALSHNKSAASKPGSLRRLLVPVLFAGSLWLVWSLLDARLAGEAEALLAAAQADLHQHQLGAHADQAWRYHTPPLEADVCNVLSGGLWLGFLLPKSNRVTLPDEMRLEPARFSRCGRGSRTVLVFVAG